MTTQLDRATDLPSTATEATARDGALHDRQGVWVITTAIRDTVGNNFRSVELAMVGCVLLGDRRNWLRRIGAGQCRAGLARSGVRAGPGSAAARQLPADRRLAGDARQLDMATRRAWRGQQPSTVHRAVRGWVAGLR